MPNVGNEKAAELLRDEDAVEGVEGIVKMEWTNRDAENASETVVEKGVPATSTEVKQDIAEAAMSVKGQLKLAQEVGKEIAETISKRTRKPAPKTILSNLVEIYKEKIALVEHVQHVEMALAVGIDTEVISSKGGRDIIITLQKEIEEAKNKALLAIQAL